MKRLKLFSGRKITRMKIVIVAMALLLTIIPISIFAADDPHDQTANADIVRSNSYSYKLKGETNYIPLDENSVIADSTKIDTLHAEFRFDLLDTDVDGDAVRTMHAGDYYLVDLPVEVEITNPVGGAINDVAAPYDTIANYSFVQETPTSPWQVKIEFTSYVDDISRFSIYGGLAFDFTFDLTSVPEGTTTNIIIPITSTVYITIEVTKPVPPDTMPISLTKSATSYTNSTRILVWTVNMLPTNGKFSGCIFKDTIDTTRLEMVSLRHGSVNLVMGVDYTYDNLTGEIVYNIPTGRDGTNYQNITITTSVKRSVYGNLTQTSITNQANLSGGDEFVDINSNTSTQTITPNWLSKSGAIFEGNRIKWTINVNTTRQDMYNAVVTDHLRADVVLDQNSVYVGATKIDVFVGSHVPADNAEMYGLYIDNLDGTYDLEIYLPRVTPSNASRTITFVTDVVEPVSVPGSAPLYNNSVSLVTNFVSDNNQEGTVSTPDVIATPVAVPVVSVDKSHATISADDKRYGTITWNVSAASNLASYGQSQIIDTLPANQSFDNTKIYWVNQAKYIDELSTGAKAEIVTVDGIGTLTITFDSNNALATQQTFTIKTVIDSDVYGQNINSTFTNQAEAILLLGGVGSSVVDSDTDTDSVTIQNTVIGKSVSVYSGNTTKLAQNPRVNFSIVVNSNLMPLSDVVVTDDLNNIVTEFKPTGGAFATVPGVNWTYVADSMTIQKNSGSLDTLDLASIASAASYTNNELTINFGTGVSVNDKYTITFTAELDVSQDNIFNDNGTIRCKGNIGEIVAGGLKPGTISTPPTGNSSEIKNEILSKSGTHIEATQQASWTINLNQHEVALGIPTGLDNPQIVDVLPVGLTLDPTSIKLYEAEFDSNGNFSNIYNEAKLVSNVEYTYTPATEPGMEGKYILKVNLPDNQTAYTLKFSTDVSGSLLGTQVSNSVYYMGESSTQNNTSQTTVTFTSVSGGGSVLKTAITVNKYNKDTGAVLDGSVFALYWLKNGTEPIFVRNQTVVGGITKFRGLTRGEQYTVTEVSTPSGYLLDDPNPVAFTAPGTGDATPISFYNTPTKTGDWIPKAIKNLDGRNIDRPFSFVITEGSDEVMNGVTEDGTVDFLMSNSLSPVNITNFTDSHIFDLSDPAGTEYLVTTKTFEMTEVFQDLSGYEFDPSVHDLIVKVYNVKGQSYLKVVIEDEEGNILSDLIGNFLTENIPYFTNIYRADGSILITAQKTLNCKEVKKDFFTFAVQEFDFDTDEPIGEEILTTNRLGGNVIFPLIEYTQADAGKDFYYHVTEVDTERPGFIIDNTIFTVRVSVVDNGDGTVTATKEILSPEEIEMIEFENIYDPLGTVMEFKFKKVIAPELLVNQKYYYTLKETDKDRNALSEIQIVDSTATGQVAFDEIDYDKEDIGKKFYYTIYELNEDKDGYIYDRAIYYIIVEVTDNCDGVITTDITIIKSVDGREAVILGEIEFSEPEPLTSDKTPIVLYSTLMVLSLGTIFFVGRKRIKE